MFRMDTNRRVAVLAVVVVLSLGSPLAAAGWEMPTWASPGDFLRSITSVLSWLGVRPIQENAPTCDQGMGIDPNGRCLKALSFDHGSSIDPNGARATTDGGLSIDPNGSH
jgi:hypothetical protein